MHIIYIYIYNVKYLKILLWLSFSWEASENLIENHKGRKHQGHIIKPPIQKNVMTSITTEFSQHEHPLNTSPLKSPIYDILVNISELYL